LDDGDAVLAPLSQLSFVERDDDPMTSHLPDEVDCDTLVGWTIETGLFEVMTARCNYRVLSKPAAISVSAGSRVKTRITYLDLTVAEPTAAHLAILVDRMLLWETTIANPSPASSLETLMRRMKALPCIPWGRT
jgi:hypothetical protein